MFAALDRLADAVRSERPPSVDAQLALSVLYKRAYSCARSLDRTATRRLTALPAPPSAAPHQLSLLGNDEDLDPSDETATLSAPLLENAGREHALLAAVARAASLAAARERKIDALRRLLDRLERRKERAIVFTEYRDTLLYVHARLCRAAVVIHGGMAADERRRSIEAFVRGDERLLLATDAAGEGLNLQQSCRIVINLELPWNPMRLEQRIGRVDRLGQERRVHVFHLIARDTGEMDVLARLEHRLARAGATIGVSDPLGAPDPLPDPPASPSDIRLAQEAAAEHARLTGARALDPPGSPVRELASSSSDTLVAFPRRRQLRTVFNGRTLAVLRWSMEDGVGRPIGAHLTTLVFPTPSGNVRASKERLLALAQSLGRLPLMQIDPALDRFRSTTERALVAFWERRAVRERSIERSLEAVPQAPAQQGLFDRRADEAALAAARARQSARVEARMRRIAAAACARSVDARPPQTALLLIV